MIHGQPGWECVRFEPAGPGPLPDGFLCHELDAAAVADKAALLSAVAAALDFPVWFGRNWDALDECLADLDLGTAPGLVLVVRRAGRLWRDAPLSAGRLVQAWLGAAEGHAKEGRALHLVFADLEENGPRP